MRIGRGSHVRQYGDLGMGPEWMVCREWLVVEDVQHCMTEVACLERVEQIRVFQVTPAPEID